MRSIGMTRYSSVPPIMTLIFFGVAGSTAQ